MMSIVGARDAGDMVDAWIVMKDDVFGRSGEATWTSLVKALEEVKQTSLAAQIKKDIGKMSLFLILKTAD